MWKYLLKRLALLIPTLFGIVVLTFGVIQFVPGGPVEQKIAELKNRQRGEAADSISKNAMQKPIELNEEQLQKIKEMYGFDKPVLTRFGIVVKKLFTFDFGESYFRQARVIDIFWSKLPVSLSLGTISFFLMYLVSVPLGISKAMRQGSAFDELSSALILLAYAIPGVILAIGLVMIFCGGNFVSLFPLRGLTSDNFSTLSPLEKLGDYLWHLVLPIIAYTINSFAKLTIQTRNLFLEEISSQYVLTARAKGLSEKLVIWKHVFRNAMIIIITGIPGNFLFLFFAGSIFIETVFTLDGVGLLMYESMLRRDYPLVLGELFIMSLMSLAARIIADVFLVCMDPRISFVAAPGA